MAVVNLNFLPSSLFLSFFLFFLSWIPTLLGKPLQYDRYLLVLIIVDKYFGFEAKKKYPLAVTDTVHEAILFLKYHSYT